MYQWNTTSFPAAPFDGQIYVDDKRLVWKWNQQIGAWLRSEQMYLREVARFWIEATGWSSTTLLGRMYGSGRAKHQWDEFFNLTFCELHTSQSDQHLYQAHLSQSELDAWVLGTLAQSGGSFTENAEVIAYEVVDPTIRCTRIQVWNSMYSSARGAAAYNRRWGRQRQGLPEASTSTSKWRGGAGYWTDGFTEPGRNFLAAFHGIVAPSNPPVSDGLIWFHSSHRNLYHHPKVGSLVLASNRRVYNNATATYEAGTSYFTVGTPRVFWRVGTSVGRILELPEQCVRGAQVLTNRLNGVMVYPLQDGDHYAFYVKPIGVDWIAMSFNSDATHQIVSIGHYGDSAESQRRAPVGEWNAARELSFRFSLFDSVPLADSNHSSGLDSSYALQKLTFYARNTTTGVVSEPFDTEIKVVRRKCNISTSFEPRRLPR